ncbi:MAG TPA: hypothetical protein VFO16_01630 [Pseudonocardiaceae bacterium]|nr:hypothetical protein [Pseudonocardiaceae bacterium]
MNRDDDRDVDPGSGDVEDAESHIATIDSLLATRDYEWCRDTLEGIRETMMMTGRATLRQREAIDHIIDGCLRGKRRSY